MAPETELQLTVLVVHRIIEVFHKKLPAIVGSPDLTATARAAFHRLSGACGCTAWGLVLSLVITKESLF